MCDNCLNPQPACKQLSIVQPPKLLIVHLKRFDALKQSKINTHINFPLEDLNFYPFMQRRNPFSADNSCDNSVSNVISNNIITSNNINNVINEKCLIDSSSISISRNKSESNES